MVFIIIIEKTGIIKSLKIKNFIENELYKKCNFKNGEGFSKKTTWDIIGENKEPNKILLYGKTEGRANNENKYEFPPPADNILFFGSCVLIKTDLNNKIIDLSTEEWNKYYNQFYGGFDDITSLDEDDDEEEDDEEDDDISLTKQGYKKDNFVVDDNEEEVEDEEDEDEEEEEDEVPLPAKKNTIRKKINTRLSASAIKKNVEKQLNQKIEQQCIYDENPELTEENYI